MVILASVGAGVRAMSLSAPALAEQSRHTTVAHPAASEDTMPVPALVGGIVLAFAVGLTAGQVHRRRRTTVRRRTAATRPPAAVATPARPAPPPPEAPAPAEPKPIDIAPAPVVAPAPPPPEPRPTPPQVVKPPAPPRRPAPKPPEPVVPAPDAELAEAPEVPRAEATGPELPDPTAPLTEAPEALNAPRESAPPPAAPVRRFARATPWPAAAAALWTCEIGWKAGYRKSSFRAMAAPPGSNKREPVGDSPAVAWTLMADPEPPTPELAVRVRALMNALEAAGWQHIGRGPRWFEQRFVWRGAGEPPQIAVPELSGHGEAPEA
jgi:outer membrane biosynthesis protein TonB